MPSKYVVRSFKEKGYYHVFNRGVEKRIIFNDYQDYQVFKYYLFIYLSPIETVLQKYPMLPLRLQGKNLNGQLELLAYCLMPNHFHLLTRQETKDATSKFMKQLTNAYTEYFNEKYARTGSLMAGPFKTTSVPTDELLLHISRYIHLNPLVANLVKNLKDYKWSSYKNYIGEVKGENFVKKEVIQNYFPKIEEYKNFIEDQADYAKKLHHFNDLIID